MTPLKSNEFYTSYDASHLKGGGLIIKTMSIFSTDNTDDGRMIYDPVPKCFVPIDSVGKPLKEDKYRVHTPFCFNTKDVLYFNQADHINYTTLWMTETFSISVRIPFDMVLELKLQN